MVLQLELPMSSRRVVLKYLELNKDTLVLAEFSSLFAKWNLRMRDLSVLYNLSSDDEERLRVLCERVSVQLGR